MLYQNVVHYRPAVDNYCTDRINYMYYYSDQVQLISAHPNTYAE